MQLQRPVVEIEWESVREQMVLPLELIGEKRFSVDSLLLGGTDYGRKLGRFENEVDFHRKYVFYAIDGDIEPLSQNGTIRLPNLIINGVEYPMEGISFLVKKTTNIVAINGC